jgi:hypothetical protein
MRGGNRENIFTLPTGNLSAISQVFLIQQAQKNKDDI